MFRKEFGKKSVLLGTPTGVSAVLINGKTLHSIFKIPRKTNKFTSLKGEQARDMCNTMKDVKILILDEYSMIGCNTLSMINRRCKEALGNDKDFGGLMVILLGDIKQLPSVKDNPFFSKTQKSLLGKEGKALINNFEKVFVLKTSHRQANDQSFLNLLDKMSDMQMSSEDYRLLTSRFTYNVSVKEKDSFEDALRLFATKDEVKQYNIEKLAQLKDDSTGTPNPVLKIPAKHNCSQASKESTDSAEGLEKDIFLAKGCKIMLKSNVWLTHKLCNGTTGTVHDILFHPQKGTPSVILCNFPSYDGPSIIPGTKLVPIKAVLKSWTNSNGINCTRFQFPITLCYACSIHKSQGMTLEKAVINIGKSDFSLGLSYVAFSRVRCLTNLIIEPFLQKRLIPSPRTLATLEMRQDFLTL
ncbi:uncharacterized protein LOC127750779 [Frankliniella occidentalis]|uniref:ATP-dependent DNA helicase n=1 Tax=Frankliniella occidentalis TaxID=133901 RepID=A0A9C6X4X3_FRAOC|nr:uncharacterized protein LOC127750779 [Frankliniella occidentalis]